MGERGHKLLIIDDHRLFADGLGLMLSQLDPNFDITVRYNPRNLLDNIIDLASYDLVLIDLNMPNLNGADFLSAIYKQGINIKVLIVSGSEKISDVEQVVSLGANGFVPKNTPSIEILEAIRKVLDGEFYLPKDLAESVDWSVCNRVKKYTDKQISDMPSLGSRQLEVLRLMHEGHTNKKIGLILGISESAIKSHISIIFKTLNIHNRTAAIKLGIELGLI